MSGIDVVFEMSPLPHIRWLREYGVHPASPSSVDKLVKTCPKQFDATYVGKHVNRIKFKDTIHTTEGKDIHTNAEEFILHEKPIDQKWLVELPRFQQTLDEYCRDIDKAQAFSPEIKLSANSAGMSIWEDATVRCIADLNLDMTDTHRIITDWKSNGAVRPDGGYRSPTPKPFQIEMIGLLSFLENPNLQTVEARFEFLRHGLRYSYLFDRSKWTYIMINGKGKETEKDFTFPHMMNQYWDLQMSGQFRARQGFLCEKWCDVTDCDFQGKPFRR